MWIFRAVFMLAMALGWVNVTHADTFVPVEAYRAASQFVLKSRYPEAEMVLDGLIAGKPREPLGYLLKAAVIRYAATDYEDDSREKEFFALLDRAETLAESKLWGKRNDKWARYCVCSTDCFRGMWLVSGGSFVRGLMKSRSGANGLAEMRIADPGFYDAYLCDGSYRFWKSTAKLPFMDDERNAGIADVRTAIERGRLTGPVSNTILLEMLLERDSGTAVVLGEQLMDRYPDCRLFAWQLGEAYKKLGRYDAAERVFTALAEKYAADPRDDGSGRIRCWWKMAVLARSLGKTNDCREYCGKIVRLGRAGTVVSRQAERIAGAKRMMSELTR